MSKTWKWFVGIGFVVGLGSFLYWSGSFRTEGPRYEIVELGTLGGEMSVAYAINDKGEVVGQSETAEGEKHAFIWDATRGMRAIPGITRKESRARGINNKGQVVGSESDPIPQPGRSRTGQSRPTFSKGTSSPEPAVGGGYGVNRDKIQIPVPHGFVWSESEGKTDLSHPDYAGCDAFHISDYGHIAGALAKENGGMRNANWLSAAEVIEPTSPTIFRATRFNDKGQCAGAIDIRASTSGLRFGSSVAAVFDGTETIEIPETKGLKSLRVRDINNRGEILGRYSKGNLDQPFVWSATDGIVKLKSSRALYLEPERFNDAQQVIGAAETIFLVEQLSNLGVRWNWFLRLVERFEGEPERYPVLWDREMFLNLNNLIPRKSGWESFGEATDINDRGWIVGSGVYKGSTRAFLLKPEEK
jgi:probable HAF family extracellular repeat protein